jgi:ATP-dependent helicase HrpB
MLIAAGARGWGTTAAEVAALLSERGLGGSDADLETRLARWRRERGGRAEAARGLARRWAAMAGVGGEGPLGGCVALGFPDRIARKRGGDGGEWASSGGRGFRLDPASSLARADYLAVADVQGAASGARVLAAAPIDAELVETLFADTIAVRREVRFDAATAGVRASRVRRLGALALASGDDDSPDAGAVVAALLDGVRAGGLDLLPFSDAARRLRERAAFARRFDPAVADLSDAALLGSLGAWLPPLLAGRRRLAAIDASALTGALETHLGWPGRQAVDRLAPSELLTPAGSRHGIDYAADGGPAVEVRVQALFGLGDHPAVAGGRVPLVLKLTSPAGRPIQTTTDLPGFWRGSWAAVAKEMRGRYPKHPWPDDPASAAPTLRAKPRPRSA